MPVVEIPEFMKALQEAFDLVPIQIRDPSYTAPSFWSATLNLTRARPIPIAPGWVDLLEIPKMADHARVLERFIATCQNSAALGFRWIVDGHLLDANFVTTIPGIDQHLNRFAAAPYPCTYRTRQLRFGSAQRVVLQTQNRTAFVQIAFAAVQGWYYPTLGSTNEITKREGVTDDVRNF